MRGKNETQSSEKNSKSNNTSKEKSNKSDLKSSRKKNEKNTSKFCNDPHRKKEQNLTNTVEEKNQSHFFDKRDKTQHKITETTFNKILKSIKDSDQKQKPCKIHGYRPAAPKKNRHNVKQNSPITYHKPFVNGNLDEGEESEVSSYSISSISSQSSNERSPRVHEKKSILKSKAMDLKIRTKPSRSNIRFEPFADKLNWNNTYQLPTAYKPIINMAYLNQPSTTDLQKLTKMKIHPKYLSNENGCSPTAQSKTFQEMQSLTRTAPYSRIGACLNDKSDRNSCAQQLSKSSISILSKFNQINANPVNNFCLSPKYKRTALSLLKSPKEQTEDVANHTANVGLHLQGSYQDKKMNSKIPPSINETHSHGLVSEFDAISLISKDSNSVNEYCKMSTNSNSAVSNLKSSFLKRLNESGFCSSEPMRPLQKQISNTSGSSRMDTSCSSDCSKTDLSGTSRSSEMDINSVTNSVHMNNFRPTEDVKMEMNRCVNHR